MRRTIDAARPCKRLRHAPGHAKIRRPSPRMTGRDSMRITRRPIAPTMTSGNGVRQ
jgi:hypothetical protein